MAGYIKGVTIEFGADVTKLNDSLGKVQGRLSKTQSELKAVNTALKFRPGNTTLLQQKFKLLEQAVGQTTAKLNGLRAMQKKMDDNKVDKQSAAYRQLQREIIKTENNLKTAQARLKQFGTVGRQQALAVGNAFKTAGSKIKAAGRSITTTFSVYGLAGIYAGSKLIAMSEKQAQAEQKLAEIYKTRMGVGKKATKSTLDLAAALQKEGVVGDEVTIAGAQQLATYAKYPGTVNKMLPALTNLLVQQKGLNGTQEDAAALANLFGKAMMGQTGALKRAGISFTKAQEEVLKYGTEEEKAAMIAEVVNQNVGNMNKTFAETDAGKIQQAKNDLGDMGEEIGAVLLPAVADLVGWMRNHLLPKIQQFIEFLKQHPAIAKFALAFSLITAALGPVLIIVGSLVSTIGSLITIFSTLGISFAAIAGPVAIAIAALVAIIAIGVKVYKNWDTIKAKAKTIWSSIKTSIITPVATIVSSVKSKFNSLKNSVTTIWNNIKTAITSPIKKAKETISSTIQKIKEFFPLSLGKLFHFSIPKITVKGGKAPWGFGGKGKKPDFGLSWEEHATGGIFTRPTLLQSRNGAGHVVGEAGAEAILPLSDLWSHMNALGDSIVNGVIAAGAMGGGGGQATINLYAFPNGPQMGSWVVNTYDTYKRRLG